MITGSDENVPDNDQATERDSSGLSGKLLMTAVVAIVLALLFEAGSRVVYAYRYEIQDLPLASGIWQKNSSLNAYEMPAPGRRLHWVLRPGYDANMEQVVADKKNMGRDAGAKAIQSALSNPDGNPRSRLRINAHGFKGPELDASHSRLRILSLGDSTTFGVGADDYPRRMEAALNGRGIPVEVINGGVEGYSPRNILYEIERYKALKPEIITLYIGWNALFSGNPWPDAWENRLRVVWLYKTAARALRVMTGGQREFAVKMYNRRLNPFPDSPKVKALEKFTPPFMNRIEKIIDEFESIKSRVVLVTLPGLFTMSAKPSPRALKIGHLPYFTENPFVLAKLTERFNIALRTLASRRGLGLVDLEKWSVQALRPRESYFSDSVHLTVGGLELIGAFMTDQFANRLLKR